MFVYEINELFICGLEIIFVLHMIYFEVDFDVKARISTYLD